MRSQTELLWVTGSGKTDARFQNYKSCKFCSDRETTVPSGAAAVGVRRILGARERVRDRLLPSWRPSDRLHLLGGFQCLVHPAQSCAVPCGPADASHYAD